MSNNFGNYPNETENQHDEDWSASELPSRKERHRHNRNNKKSKDVSNDAAEEETGGFAARLPLIRIWLILFLFIIGLVFSYPLWSEV